VLVIAFGPRSLVLLVGTLHGLVLALLLLRTRRNVVANRLLALLLMLVSLRVLPYIIGFAGFYDAYPWLSFLPYEWSLAIGPVLWLYVTVVSTGALSRHWRWHLVPGVLQGVYYVALFVRPLAFKNAWNGAVHVPYVIPLETAWALIALAGYLVASWREYIRYQRWLDATQSNREEFRLDWLRVFLLTLGVTVALWAVTEFVDGVVQPLTYFDRFPLYVWFSALVYALGLVGVRTAVLVYPRAAPELAVLASNAPAMVVTPASWSSGEAQQTAVLADGATHTPAEAPDDTRTKDWGAVGADWRNAVWREGWWRDPELTAPQLARLLATNTTYLSRALNDGLGMNFNEFINRLRVEHLRSELARADQAADLLPLALAAGFNSKASFNRVFKRITGLTPSAFREQQRMAPAAVRPDSTVGTSQTP